MRVLKIASLLIAAFIAAAFILILNSSVCFAEGENYTFFVGHTSSDCKIVTVEGCAALKKLTLKDVCGESTTYESLDINQFIEKLNGKILFTEELSDSINYYCTADLPYSVNLYGAQINLHICVKESGVTVASPIIFGGY